MTLRILVITHILMASICVGCEKNDNSIKMDCTKGKFIGNYCEGAVIQILDDNDIGRDWISMDGSKNFMNSVVASIDTLLTKNIINHSLLFSQDSIFYFKYRNGGYARKQYNICEPSAFITITNVYKTCTNYEN